MIDGIYFTKFKDSSLGIVYRVNGKTSLYYSTIRKSLSVDIAYEIQHDQRELIVPEGFLRSTN